MRVDLTRRELADQRRSLIGWAICLVLLNAVIALSWPAIEGATGMDTLAENYPDAVKKLFGLMDPLTSPVGYLNSQLFAYFLPMLLLVYGIGRGARTIAGDEEDGKMEMLSALPLGRPRIVLEKALALVVGVALLGLTVWLSLAAASRIVGLNVGFWHLGAATAGSSLVALAGGLLALMTGAIFSRRGTAIAVAAGFIAITYVLQGLALVVDPLAWSDKLSFIYWAQRGSPLRNGIDDASLLVFATCMALFVTGAVIGFTRRDLRT